MPFLAYLISESCLKSTILLLALMPQIIPVLGHSCFTCDDPFKGYYQCKKKEQKTVDFSGLCGARTCDRSCSHQIGRNSSECQFTLSDCPLEETRDWPLLQCEGPSNSCQCPEPAAGPVPLEDDVVITAYSFECSCAVSNQHVSAPDIRIRNSGWSTLSLVSRLQQDRAWCGQFRLSDDADADGRWLQFDCPLYQRSMEGRAILLQLCTRQHTVIYWMKLPRRRNITGAALDPRTYSGGRPANDSWEPLIAVHMHRSDRLVYSVQRPPPGLNITQYRVSLVRCRDEDCRVFDTVPGTERHRQEAVSDSALHPGVFRVEYDAPEAGGNISLLVLPQGARPTLSAVVFHPGRNTALLASVLSVLVLILVLAIAAFVWFKFFRKPKMPAVVETLVLYNSNSNLARYFARLLDTYCMMKTKLDVVDIPRAGADMDPVKWLNTELSRCQHVLLLVFPETAAPSVYSQLYHMGVRHLALEAGDKTVVVGYAGGADCAPLPRLPGARRCRLPAELAVLVRAVRGAVRPGAGYVDARDLARSLLRSEDGAQLARLLSEPATAAPPPEAALLPPTVQPPPPLQAAPLPPERNGHLLAEHVQPLDTVLDPPQAPPQALQADRDGERESDDDIQWY